MGKGSFGEGLLLGPRPPGEGRRGRHTPPSRPSGAPSAAITPARPMAITPLRATARWPAAGHIVQPQDPPRWPNRPCPHYHLLGVMSIPPLPAGSDARMNMRASRLEGAIRGSRFRDRRNKGPAAGLASIRRTLRQVDRALLALRGTPFRRCRSRVLAGFYTRPAERPPGCAPRGG